MPKAKNVLDSVVEQMADFDRELAMAAEMVARDFPNAKGVVEDLNELRVFVRQVFQKAYRCQLEDILVGVIGYGERMRVLWDYANHEIEKVFHYIKPDEWGKTFVNIVATLMREVGQFQDRPN